MLPQRVQDWRERHPNVESLAFALLIALGLRSSVVQAFWVPSGSMLPTIQIGDHLFVNKLAYSVRLPFVGTQLFRTGSLDRGEVVVFVSPADGQTDLIKRVIAIGGDKVEVKNKKVFINDQPIEDTHAHYEDRFVVRDRDNFGPVVVPPGKFFVLGDNRDRSQDSRYWGFANEEDVKGKATFIYWSRQPPGDWKSVFVTAPRLDRFGHFIR